MQNKMLISTTLAFILISNISAKEKKVRGGGGAISR